MGDEEYRYAMTHPRRGKCLLFNNRKFPTLPERIGTDTDAENVKQLFTGLGFEVERLNDVAADEMKAKLTNESSKSHEDADCFLCVILSHGDNGIIYGSDSLSIQLEDLMDTMKGNNCPSLNGKPKMFIVQSCNYGVEESDSIPTTEEKVYIIPAEADVLYVCSTIPGSMTWRQDKRGSIFIDVLCNVFNQYGQEKDILWLLTRVNHEVISECGSTTHKYDIPQTVSMLTKDVFLKNK